MKQLKIGFLVSHGGSNMQAIIDACKKGKINAKACVVISNNSKSKALQRARDENIPYYHVSNKTHPDLTKQDEEIESVMKNYNVDIIILAGYMKKIGDKTLKRFKNRMLNIHPSLLPKYGGRGMYGDFVHKAVLEAQEKETGVTIHKVDEEYDTGSIINQCTIPIHKEDTVESLKDRVLKREHSFWVETLNLIIEKKLIL